ncbi:hypothetical protein [Abyssogena phaseoliformis symbiont]|uniref:hypothetical protein n=1 Tax=Abyssogena phaseoliformis symbiont TaxID=596095 RepID=UPI0019158758|nr:hypothetical protein [Abyssogena phaseoliformis symbiont]MBW5288910.1 hypothetical protein [Candidatus Ruthia sp. Apha_13_S6]
MLSYDHYKKLNIEDTDIVDDKQLKNQEYKKNFKRYNIAQNIDYINFNKNLGVVIDGDKPKEKYNQDSDQEQASVLIDSFEILDTGLDGAVRYDAIKIEKYQINLPSGSFLTLDKLSVNDKTYKEIKDKLEQSGSDVLRTRIVSTGIYGSGNSGVIGYTHSFYVEPHTPAHKKKGIKVLDVKKLDVIKGYIELRDAVTALLNADSAGGGCQRFKTLLFIVF